MHCSRKIIQCSTTAENVNELNENENIRLGKVKVNEQPEREFLCWILFYSCLSSLVFFINLFMFVGFSVYAYESVFIDCPSLFQPRKHSFHCFHFLISRCSFSSLSLSISRSIPQKLLWFRLDCLRESKASFLFYAHRSVCVCACVSVWERFCACNIKSYWHSNNINRFLLWGIKPEFWYENERIEFDTHNSSTLIRMISKTFKRINNISMVDPLFCWYYEFQHRVEWMARKRAKIKETATTITFV